MRVEEQCTDWETRSRIVRMADGEAEDCRVIIKVEACKHDECTDGKKWGVNRFKVE